MRRFQEAFQGAFQNTYNSISLEGRGIICDSALFSESHVRSDSSNGIAILKSETSQISIPSSNIQSQYELQDLIRPVFGKAGINQSCIGTHPDFIKLERINDQAVKHYICTIFIDLKSSTRLALLYNLEDVFRLKNAFIKTCIDTVRAFDGHVHRLMGDAVMGFFGGSSIRKEDAIIDAINCATTLHLLFKIAIIPWMDKEGYDSEGIGFRVGLDFGDDDSVLWASYGYDSVSEVTATGLQVDMASKLQGHARKNQAMLGQTLLDFIDWPEDYALKKIKKQGNVEKDVIYVEPNITDRNNVSLNYKMRMLNFDRLLNLSPLVSNYNYDQKITENIKHNGISYRCYVVENGSKQEYISMSKFLGKRKSLSFEINVIRHGMRYNYPLKILFTKTNYGKEAGQEARQFEPKVRWVNQNNSSRNYPILATEVIDLEEATQYRGLHTMKAEVVDSSNNIIFKDWISVLIV